MFQFFLDKVGQARKMMEDMYPKIAGKPLADYDMLKRADCLAFGKEVLAGIFEA